MRNHCCQILRLFKRTWKPRFVMWHFPTFKSHYWPKKIQLGLNIAHNDQFVISICIWKADLCMNILVQLETMWANCVGFRQPGISSSLWCRWSYILSYYVSLSLSLSLSPVILCPPENSPDLLLYVRWWVSEDAPRNPQSPVIVLNTSGFIFSFFFFAFVWFWLPWILLQ